MSISNDFEKFCDEIKLKNKSAMETTVGEIAKKLNKEYYNLEDNKEDHMYIVGSVGRETAMNGSSDLDIIFDLPSKTFKKFDSYKGNGQSALLQEVKNVLKQRYPKTDISGDGQVVVIEFTNYTVELVPGFKQSDDSFKYPNTHDGGNWKKTDPLPEKSESIKTDNDTNGNFSNMCHILRAWKNKKGFKFGGLLIDTLVYNFLNTNKKYKLIGFDSYLDTVKELFKYLKDLDKEQKYWFALGSNQHVYNCDNGKFVDEAQDAYNKIKDMDSTSEDLNSTLREIFGNKFPKEDKVKKESNSNRNYNYISFDDTEEFIEDKVQVDIRYNLSIECRVKQNGWRDKVLSYMLKNHEWLKPDKSLIFFIEKTDVPKPYNIYWKVKNEGDVAKARNCIRGQILKTNKDIQYERTCFKGPHYVECYIIKNGICVARDRIEVPIKT